MKEVENQGKGSRKSKRTVHQRKQERELQRTTTPSLMYIIRFSRVRKVLAVVFLPHFIMIRYSQDLNVSHFLVTQLSSSHSSKYACGLKPTPW